MGAGHQLHIDRKSQVPFKTRFRFFFSENWYCYAGSDRSISTRSQKLTFTDYCNTFVAKWSVSSRQKIIGKLIRTLKQKIKQTTNKLRISTRHLVGRKEERVVESRVLLIIIRNCLKNIKTFQFLLLQFRQVTLHLFPACFQCYNSLSLFIHLSFGIAKSFLKSSETLAVWNVKRIRKQN